MKEVHHPHRQALDSQCTLLKQDLEHLFKWVRELEALKVRWIEDPLSYEGILLEINLPTPEGEHPSDGLLLFNKNRLILEERLIPLHFGGENTLLVFEELDDQCSQLLYRVDHYLEGLNHKIHPKRRPKNLMRSDILSRRTYVAMSMIDLEIEEWGLSDVWRLSGSKKIWERYRLREIIYQYECYGFQNEDAVYTNHEMLRLLIAIPPHKVNPKHHYLEWKEALKEAFSYYSWVEDLSFTQGVFVNGRHHLELRLWIRAYEL